MTEQLKITCPRCNVEILPVVIETPDTIHHAKEVCPDCGGFLRWLSKPKNENKRLPSKFTPESLGISWCEFCLRQPEMLGIHEVLEIHHKMPIELGGEDVKTNILVLCTYCHKTAHQRHIYLYKHFKPKEIDPLASSEVLRSAAQPLKPEISIPLISNEEFPIYQYHIDEWKTAYPAVDVLQALRAMRQWCLSNPRKRKTERGVRRFITGWLERLQNKGGKLPPETIRKPIDDRPAIFPK